MDFSKTFGQKTFFFIIFFDFFFLSIFFSYFSKIATIMWYTSLSVLLMVSMRSIIRLENQATIYVTPLTLYNDILLKKWTLEVQKSRFPTFKIDHDLFWVLFLTAKIVIYQKKSKFIYHIIWKNSWGVHHFSNYFQNGFYFLDTLLYR